MAEGLARTLAKADVEILSAGSKPTQINQFAIKAMREISIDISQQYSKCVNEIDITDVDFVITLCADEVCPVFIGNARKLHWPFVDPAAVGRDDDATLAAFRDVRDQIKEKLKSWLDRSGILKSEWR